MDGNVNKNLTPEQQEQQRKADEVQAQKDKENEARKNESKNSKSKSQNKREASQTSGQGDTGGNAFRNENGDIVDPKKVRDELAEGKGVDEEVTPDVVRLNAAAKKAGNAPVQPSDSDVRRNMMKDVAGHDLLNLSHGAEGTMYGSTAANPANKGTVEIRSADKRSLEASINGETWRGTTIHVPSAQAEDVRRNLEDAGYYLKDQ